MDDKDYVNKCHSKILDCSSNHWTSTRDMFM